MKAIENRFFHLLMFCVLGLGLLLRVYKLDLPNRYMFDEDMHAFTANLMAKNDPIAYEWWHPALSLYEQNKLMSSREQEWLYRPPAIEWLHPPLSKLIQATSIYFLGNHPLAWRLPSALAGSAMVIIIGLLLLKMTGNATISLLISLIAALDPFLITQSQIASADIFLALFTLATFWAYLRFKQHKSNLNLILLGVALGLTLASKWSGWFILPGIFLIEILTPSKNLSFEFKRWLTIIGVALAIYIFSFSQMLLHTKSLTSVVELHRQAFWYQTHTQFTHPQQSRPQEWLLGQKPVWYFFEQSEKGDQEIIAQPSWWLLWLSELAFVWLTADQVKKRFPDKQAKYLILILLSLFLPWFFIQRAIFIYHFLPSYVLLILILGYSIHKLKTIQFHPKTAKS